MSALYYCTRQRAGPLVKESRARRPRLSATDDAWERRDKKTIVKACQSAVCRTAVDRLELKLALFGYDGAFYTLTFNDDNLPDDFKGVRRALRVFLTRLRRSRNNKPFDYIYAIEGLHGDHRWHIHMILRQSDFDLKTIGDLWQNGFVDCEPVLKAEGGFRRIAEYLNKERRDGVYMPVGSHPWSCSRSLSKQLPPVERWKSKRNSIKIPRKAFWKQYNSIQNAFGEYKYASYILPYDSPSLL